MTRMRTLLAIVLAMAAVWTFAQGQAGCQHVAPFGVVRDLYGLVIGGCHDAVLTTPGGAGVDDQAADVAQNEGPSNVIASIWTLAQNAAGLGNRQMDAIVDQDDTASAESSADRAESGRRGAIVIVLFGALASLSVLLATRERKPVHRRWVGAVRPAMANRGLPALPASPLPEPESRFADRRESMPLQGASRAATRRDFPPRSPSELAVGAPTPTPGPTPDVPFSPGAWILRPLVGAFAAVVLALTLGPQVAGLAARAFDSSDLGMAAEPLSASAVMPIVFDEQFRDSRSSWLHDPTGVAWFATGPQSTGGYEVFARQPGQFVAIGAPIAASFRDVALTAVFRKTGGPPGGAYGLIVRSSNDSPLDGRNQRGRFYLFEVSDVGEVGVLRREDDHWVELLPKTTSSAVNPNNAENELVARAVGQRLAFVINGVEVASVQDSMLVEGATGIFVSGDLNQILVQRFVVEAPALRLGAQ